MKNDPKIDYLGRSLKHHRQERKAYTLHHAHFQTSNLFSWITLENTLIYSFSVKRPSILPAKMCNIGFCFLNFCRIAVFYHKNLILTRMISKLYFLYVKVSTLAFLIPGLRNHRNSTKRFGPSWLRYSRNQSDITNDLKFPKRWNKLGFLIYCWQYVQSGCLCTVYRSSAYTLRLDYVNHTLFLRIPLRDFLDIRAVRTKSSTVIKIGKTNSYVGYSRPFCRKLRTWPCSN